jgi:hypothetical protein
MSEPIHPASLFALQGENQGKNQGAEFLLSGASGMIGRALAQGLSAQQIGWKQLVRRAPAHSYEMGWDALTPGADFRAVVHLSGANVAAHRWSAAYKAEMRSSRIETTARLANALAALPQKPEVLLVASAIGFYGNRGEELLTEQSTAGTGYFSDLCQQWENAAAPAANAGIRVVHLRFGVVLGSLDGRIEGALAKMLPLFRLGLGGPIGNGRQWMSWIGLNDLVRAILFAAGNPLLSGALNIVAPAPVTNAEFTRELARAVHRPAILSVPAFALRLVLGAMADEALLASARVLPQRLAEAVFCFEEPLLPLALKQVRFS